MRLFLIVIPTMILWSIATFSYAHSDHEHKKVKQSKKKTTLHSHSRGTGFNFEVGLSVTKSLVNERSESGSGGSGGDDHSEHSHLHLDGDENHSDGDSDEDGGTAPPVLDPTLTARVTYNFIPSFGALFLAGYALEGGAVDPEAGVVTNISLSKRTMGNATLTASYPASKSSQDNYKITAIKLTAGPTYRLGRYNFGFAASTAYAWYSKTVIYEDDEGGQGGQFGLLDQGHEHGTNPVSPTDNGLSSSDREFSRWGGTGSIGYNIFSRLRIDLSLGAFIINHQFGSSTWLSQATVAQLTYSIRGFSGYGGILLSKEDRSLSAPSVPAINVGIGYKIE